MEESLMEENDQPSQAKQRKVDKESCSIDSVKLEEKHSQLPESKQHKTDEHNTNNVLMEDLTNKLTQDALLKLFSWLPIDDLVSVQCVCHDWRVAAHCPSLWNNYTLKLVDYKQRDEKNIHIMPALRSIEGSVDNRMLTVILKNILELKHMNCTFKPAISSSQVKKVIETYPRLETIGLDINASDILQSVQKLKASEYLKEVRFYCSAHSNFHNPCHGVSESVCQSNILQVFKVFTNSKNFSVIRGLYMSRCIFKDLFGDLPCSNVVADVIKERSQQLLSLRFVISKISSEVLNSVNMCINLRELCFSVDEMCHVNINFDKLRELQSLTVRVEEEGNISFERISNTMEHHYDPFLRNLQDSFTSCSWSHLTKLSLDLYSLWGFEILRAVICNIKHLKELRYEDYETDTEEEQLEEISSMTKLEHLSVGGLMTISYKVLKNISKLHNIRYLSLDARECYGCELWANDVADMIRSMNRLNYISFRCELMGVSHSNRASIESFINDKSPQFRFWNDESDNLDTSDCIFHNLKFL